MMNPTLFNASGAPLGKKEQSIFQPYRPGHSVVPSSPPQVYQGVYHGTAESLVKNPQYLALFNKNFNSFENHNSHKNLINKSDNFSSQLSEEIAIYKHSHDHHH